MNTNFDQTYDATAALCKTFTGDNNSSPLADWMREGDWQNSTPAEMAAEWDAMSEAEISEQLPAWAEQSKIEFKHAPRDIKVAAKADSINPRWYAVRGEGDDKIVYVWNTRRVECYDAARLDIAWNLFA